jgi:Ca2+-binding EF-hand superfamily protein
MKTFLMLTTVGVGMFAIGAGAVAVAQQAPMPSIEIDWPDRGDFREWWHGDDRDDDDRRGLPHRRGEREERGERGGKHHHHHGKHRGRGRERMMERLAVFDSNGDRVVTQEEVTAFRDAQLARFDADGNGTLSLTEYQALWLDGMRERMVDAFQDHDDDGDGEVTAAEFNERFARLVERIDRDGDGTVELDRRRPAPPAAPAPAAPPAPPADMAPDGDEMDGTTPL